MISAKTLGSPAHEKDILLVALGGNALIRKGQVGTIDEQFEVPRAAVFRHEGNAAVFVETDDGFIMNKANYSLEDVLGKVKERIGDA